MTELPASATCSTNVILLNAPVRKRGRPRKILTVSGPSDETVIALDTTSESEKVIRTSERSKRERIYYQSTTEVLHVKKSKVRTNGKRQKIRKRGRPRKMECTVVDTKKKEKPVKKVASSFFKAAKKRKLIQTRKENNEVRSYKFACHLCPGKFEIESFLKTHVNNVHNGSRRLMDCCVCGRVFNKRDSLNQHYLSHEAAEAREETFNLFQPWNDAMLEKVRNYRSHYNNFRSQQTCKVCLLQHYTHNSFTTHFRQEHSDPPEAFTLNCKFGNCQMQFKSIRIFLDHAKAEHSKEFFGKLTLYRQNMGFYIGHRVVHVWKNGKCTYKPQVPSTSTTKIQKSRSKKFEKRVSSFTPFPGNDNDDEGSDWERECGIPLHQLEMEDGVEQESDMDDYDSVPMVKRIEVECVNDNPTIKQEQQLKLSTENVKIETNEPIVPDVYEGNLSESEPVAFAILKSEIINT